MLVATVVTSTLWLLGVDMVYVFGIATFALHFIPNLGPLIATFLPMPLVIFDPGEITERVRIIVQALLCNTL